MAGAGVILRFSSPEGLGVLVEYEKDIKRLFVDKEEDRFKAWSDAIIACGYAYMLVDVFNSAGGNAKYITPESFDLLDIANLLSLNRQNGFYQMVEMIRSRL